MPPMSPMVSAAAPSTPPSLPSVSVAPAALTRPVRIAAMPAAARKPKNAAPQWMPPYSSR